MSKIIEASIFSMHEKRRKIVISTVGQECKVQKNWTLPLAIWGSGLSFDKHTGQNSFQFGFCRTLLLLLRCFMTPHQVDKKWQFSSKYLCYSQIQTKDILFTINSTSFFSLNWASYELDSFIFKDTLKFRAKIQLQKFKWAILGYFKLLCFNKWFLLICFSIICLQCSGCSKMSIIKLFEPNIASSMNFLNVFCQCCKLWTFHHGIFAMGKSCQAGRLLHEVWPTSNYSALACAIFPKRCSNQRRVSNCSFTRVVF